MCARLLSARIICGICRQDMRTLISNDFRDLVRREKERVGKKEGKGKKEMRKKLAVKKDFPDISSFTYSK